MTHYTTDVLCRTLGVKWRCDIQGDKVWGRRHRTSPFLSPPCSPHVTPSKLRAWPGWCSLLPPKAFPPAGNRVPLVEAMVFCILIILLLSGQGSMPVLISAFWSSVFSRNTGAFFFRFVLHVAILSSLLQVEQPPPSRPLISRPQPDCGLQPSP